MYIFLTKVLQEPPSTWHGAFSENQSNPLIHWKPNRIVCPFLRSRFLPGRKWSFLSSPLRHNAAAWQNCCSVWKPTSCLNKRARIGFSGHIMEPFILYKNHSTLNTSMKPLSSTASELKRNCVIKGCEKNHTGRSSDPLLLLHLIHNKPNKYAYPRSKFHYLIPLSLVKVFLYYPSCYCVQVYAKQFGREIEKYWHVSRGWRWRWGYK